jgi:endonuclease YncB( thermonuclease family)
LALLSPSLAEPIADGLEPGADARVEDITDGDTVVLDTGESVRLVALQAPKISLGRANFVDWPLGEVSRQALGALILGKRVTLLYGGRRQDRHGRHLAHLVRLEDALWVQREMLDQGMARVYSFADNRAAIDQLLEAERRARARSLGIWGQPFYAIRDPASVIDDIDSFQIVEGMIVSAALVRGRHYLNFGDDWREDFTVTVAPRDRKIFQSSLVANGLEDLAALAGHRMRVRGWIKSYNGPQIEVTHPEQIEWLD